jgi:heme exporter protein CcmD
MSGAYAFYIIGAYGLAAFSFSTLLLITLSDLRRQKRRLQELEKKI